MLTNEDLYLYLARIRYNHIYRGPLRKRMQKRWGMTGKKDPDLDSKLMNWFKSDFYPIEPEENEIIPREEWDLQAIVGVKDEALYHPHYDIWWNHVHNNYKPKHKILLVFECSNLKPYFKNKSLRYYISRYHKYCDFASIDYGIMPWEFVNLYPVRYDEWDHGAESDDMAYKYSELTKKRILEYHQRFPDHKLIFICQNNHPQRPVNELFKANIGDFRSWATICTDDDFRARYREEYSHFTRGLLTHRMLNSKFLQRELKKCVEKILGESIDVDRVKIKSYNPYDNSRNRSKSE